MVQSSEYILITLAALVGIFIIYWLAKLITRTFRGEKQLNNLESINEKYKDLVEREETLQSDLVSTTEQYNSVQFLLKSFIAVLLVAGLIAYRQGPHYIVYTA